MGTTYNLTFLRGIELIAPVVDCGSTFISSNDSTRGKFYFLTRALADPENIRLLTLAMVVQEYWIPSEIQTGSVLVASLTLISDLQSDHVDHHFIVSLGYPFYKFDFVACQLLGTGDQELLLRLRTIPRNSMRELAQPIETAYRSGFYHTSETGRFNIRQQIWQLEESPLDAITNWKWTSKNTSRNVWALAHIFDIIFAIYVVGHIVQLSMLIYQALSEGKLWAADGSVPMNKPFMTRGTVVLVFWCLTSFCELTEFCLRDAQEIVESDRIFCFTDMMRLDILYIMQNATGYFAKACKERIDVGFVFFVAMACFFFRLDIIRLSPSLVATIKELVLETAQQELRSSSMSPMQFRSPFAMQ